MEKFSGWRDAGTGIHPFLYPKPPRTDTAVYYSAFKCYLVGPIIAVIKLILILIITLLTFLLEVIGLVFIVPAVVQSWKSFLYLIFGRCILFLCGFYYIETSEVSVKKLKANSKSKPVNAQPLRQLIVSNHSSYLDILYYAYSYAPIFLGVTMDGKVARLSTWDAFTDAGNVLTHLDDSMTLSDYLKADTSNIPIVLFPEGTTSNGRGILKFIPVFKDFNMKDSKFKNTMEVRTLKQSDLLSTIENVDSNSLDSELATLLGQTLRLRQVSKSAKDKIEFLKYFNDREVNSLCFDAKATTTGPAPTDFPVSNDGSCGPITKKKCPTGTCCSQFGNCGGNPKVEDEFCGLGCQKPFGLCFAQPILAKSNTCIPNKVFAPFLDVTTKTTLFNNKNFDLNEARKITGISWYVMAFLLGNIEGGKVVPRWGGQFDLDFYKGQVKTLRDNGGDVAVSFGGFAGIELATLTNDVDEIQAAYQSVINEYQIRWIDIDIEGNNAQDAGANDRRSKALAALKRANPGLRVSFTLPVLPTGLVKLGIEVLQNAKDNKLELDLVNIMAMDYGNIKDGATAMGKHAIEAAEATFKQLQNMGLTKTTIGITTMIGNNDVAGEIFTLDNAKELNEYYLKTPFVS
ncbi:hypothetical protein HDV02_006380, partial [Globomyces sp. JEL0801]